MYNDTGFSSPMKTLLLALLLVTGSAWAEWEKVAEGDASYREQCLNRGMLAAEDIFRSLIYLFSDFGKFVNGHNLIVDDAFCL